MPVKRFQNRSDVFELWNLTIYFKFRKTAVQSTVVKLGVYNGGGNCFGGVKVKVATDTAVQW